jgi:hypothetical protein
MPHTEMKISIKTYHFIDEVFNELVDFFLG